ncbi:MAG: 2'-deoxycytidine 5'-triphosphate deaminase [Acidobacteria bacterium]|nr:2'-deoxycytidine 5'-triphosphate deaminase [Acidobacteriota bacterium]
MGITSQTVEISPGVLHAGQVELLIKTGFISSIQFPNLDADGSAFDLRLGKTAWRLKQAQRPATRELAKLKVNAERITPETDSGGAEYFEFERQNIYLAELDYHLNLPSNICGRATGKSSIGRLDLITRLLTENSTEYDVVRSTGIEVIECFQQLA